MQPRMTTKPAVFIGSSTESLAIANAIHENLEDDAHVTPWNTAAELSSTILDSLKNILNKSDFGIFVFSNEDVVQIRGEEFTTVRDNVILELGMFIGKLGLERNFIVCPKDINNLHFPTDLSGITKAFFDASRPPEELRAALGPTCNKIRLSMTRLGSLERRDSPSFGDTRIRLGQMQNNILRFIEQQSYLNENANEWVKQEEIEKNFSATNHTELYYRIEQLRLLGFITRKGQEQHYSHIPRFEYTLSRPYLAELRGKN
jgi:CAP12/Pycsar effector protein, TIR domain